MLSHTLPSHDERALPDPTRGAKAVAGGLVVAVVASIWSLPMLNGLNAVEAVTDWMVRDTSFSAMWSRSTSFQVHSWYVLLPWLQAKLWPAAPEWYLRLPSLVFVLGAAWWVRAIARRLGGAEAGLWAPVFFVSTIPVLIAGTEVRPYGLGLLLVTASMHFFLRWLDDGGRRDGVVAVCLSGFCQNSGLRMSAE